MKFVFLTGGFVGFALATLAGLAAGREAGPILRDASLGCLAGAFLFRWFWSVVVKAVSDTRDRRLKEAATAAAAAAETKPASPAMPAPVAARSR